MQYRHAAAGSYEDVASGHVLHSAPGQPAFPGRLALELLHRALEHLPTPQGAPTLWDPCCGSGQLVTVLGLLARRHLGRVVASDVDAEVVGLARRNLRLLTVAGLDARRRDLLALADQHGKASHRRAAEAAARLRDRLRDGGGDVPTEVDLVDALDGQAVGRFLSGRTPDVVFADVPYGQLTSWHGHHVDDGLERLLTTLAAELEPSSVIVVVTRARRITLPPAMPTVERVRVGHRAAAIVRAGEVGAG